MSKVSAGTPILRRAVVRNGRRLWTGTALAGVYQLCAALVPILVGVIVDRGVATGDLTALLRWITTLAAVYLVLAVTYRFGARQLQRAIAEEGHQLRVELAARILDPRVLRTGRHTGDLLSVTTTDAEYTSYLLDHIPRITSALVAVTVSAVALLLISPPLGLTVLVAIPTVLAVLNRTAPLIARRVREQQDQAGRATALATDLVTGLRPLRGIGAQEAGAGRYRRVSRHALAATVRASRTQNVYLGASTMLSTLLAGVIALVAGWFALTGRITVGQFVTVIGSAQFLVEPFGVLAVVPSWTAAARAAADRVAAVLHAGVVLPPGAAAPGGGGNELRLADVTYGPLAGLHLRLRSGEFVGVVARRPADAEALARLLAVPDAYVGDVLLDGERLEAVDRDRARRVLHSEPHRTDLFTGTLAANLARADDDGERLAGALRAAAADEVARLHPDGLGMPVTERGANLSGGQRQRVALARALLAGPPLLVLHDPTTAVDAVTERAIADGIRALRHGPDAGFGTLVITSSPTLLAATDRVVFIVDGAVAAEGPHAELVSHDDYRRTVLR
ncbi:ABC transporter ATP-binding protein [Micromonospora rifamycinica]|uniref:Putative ABC transport system ATP-binding protein n=1 Tax=Micromonospora rifamycinica TaxID=291594 RepID=A0A109INY8_9ACTN|nr:ABC transporter ATP-binding protein [Micromonospora rifamycinica]KWV34031.1 ABC transporter permease [Micromonospora rifamycinica]SCG47480.1 putative ABC transport system ATP-binding protein [Micromonospora rifamycinica]